MTMTTFTIVYMDFPYYFEVDAGMRVCVRACAILKRKVQTDQRTQRPTDVLKFKAMNFSYESHFIY